MNERSHGRSGPRGMPPPEGIHSGNGLVVPPYEGWLEPGELLAHKCYLAPGIRPGLAYRIRPTNRETPLFGGRFLPLVLVRPAVYSMRLVFQVRDLPSDELLAAGSVFTDSWEPAALALLPAPAPASDPGS